MAKMNRQTVVNERGQEMEVVQWTEAEARAYQKLYKIFQEAADRVNEFMEFLREQYGIDPKEGWHLGNGAFVRPLSKAEAPTEEAPVKATTTPPSGKTRKTTKSRGKPTVAVEAPLPVSANGHDAAGADIPNEEM